MSDKREPNYHFKQTVSGASEDVLRVLGESLLAIHRQRQGDDVDAASVLRKAWLALARHLVKRSGGRLNAHQQLFLLSGALGDNVSVRNPGGDRVTVEMLPEELYEGLLADFTAGEDAALPR